MKNKTIYITLITSLIILALMLSGCKGNISEYSKSGFAFDTIIEITVYENNKEHAEAVLNSCMNICDRYDSLFNTSNENSDIFLINHANGEAVTVSDDTIDIIEKSMHYSEISDGIFDITIENAYELWGFGDDKHDLPSDDSIKDAISKTDYKDIIIKDNTVTIPAGCKITLGAIAKGYIADKLKAYLLTENISSAIINLGGNILVLGEKPDGSSFNIGIQKPFSNNGETITSVSVKDSSVVTSGIYQRYFIKDDKIYHHILNPKDGYPINNDLSSVSIITESSTDADAYSTICMLMGYEKADKFIKSMNVSAILIDINGNIIN